MEHKKEATKIGKAASGRGQVRAPASISLYALDALVRIECNCDGAADRPHTCSAHRVLWAAQKAAGILPG